MKTLTQEFNEYFTQVYPTAGDVQRRELHRTFFAGSLVVLGKVMQLPALEEDKAVAILDVLLNEAVGTLGEVASLSKARN